MITKDLERRLRQIVRDQHIDEEILSRHESFEEIPLISRSSQLRSVAHLSPQERSSALIGFALTHSDELLSGQITALPPDFILMISVMGWTELSEGEQLLPKFWVCHTGAALLAQMSLKRASSERAALVAQVVDPVYPEPLLLESRSPPHDTDLARVFIAPTGMRQRILSSIT